MSELKRIVLRTRVLVALVVFALVGIGVTVGAVALMDFAQSEAAKEGMSMSVGFVGLGLAASAVAFGTSLLCVSSTARDYRDGAAGATLLVVPNRQRLLSARIATWMMAAVVVSLATLLPLAIMYMNMYEQPSVAYVEVACGVVGTCVLVLVAFACSTLTRRGALGMVAFLGIDMLIPTVLGMVAPMAPEAVSSVLFKVEAALPGRAADKIMSVGDFLAGNGGDWIFAAVALVAWAVIAAVVSHASFAGYAGADD